MAPSASPTDASTAAPPFAPVAVPPAAAEDLARPDATAIRTSAAAPGPARHGRRRYVAAGAAAVAALYVLVFARGLGWEWRGIFTATNATVPATSRPPR